MHKCKYQFPGKNRPLLTEKKTLCVGHSREKEVVWARYQVSQYTAVALRKMKPNQPGLSEGTPTQQRPKIRSTANEGSISDVSKLFKVEQRSSTGQDENKGASSLGLSLFTEKNCYSRDLGTDKHINIQYLYYTDS